MKKFYSVFAIVRSLLLLCAPITTHAVACHPRWNGTRTVEATCDFPASARIYGDIAVGPYTVTVPSGVVMGINLASQKITFTSGKILYQGSARSDGSVANGYAIGITYNYGTVTSCPAGMQVLSSTSPQSGFIGGLTPVGSSGTMYCAYP